MRLESLYSLSRGHFESNTYLICELDKKLFTYSPFVRYLCPPSEVLEKYCVCSVSYYSYYSSFFLSFFRQKFVRHISRRCLDQSLWNVVGISYAMWSCAFKGWFFQNGCRCHGNGQNAKKKMKNTKMIIAGYSPNRNWWNLIGTTSTSSGTR